MLTYHKFSATVSYTDKSGTKHKDVHLESATINYSDFKNADGPITLTIYVGELEVFSDTFKVVDNRKAPKYSISDNNLQITSTVADASSFAKLFDSKLDFETDDDTTVSVTAVDYVSLNETIITSSDASFKKNAGKTTIVVDTVTVDVKDKGNNEVLNTFKLDLNGEVFNVEVKGEAELGAVELNDNTMSFPLITTNNANIDVSKITVKDILGTFNFQFRNVGRTNDYLLATFNKEDDNKVTGVLTENAWITENLEGYDVKPNSEAKDVTFDEFNKMLDLRFAKDTNNINYQAPNYDGVKVEYKDEKVVVTFPDNFLRWDNIHQYKDYNYNIGMYFIADDFVEMLEEKTGLEITKKPEDSGKIKLTLQGQADGDKDTPIKVVLTKE